MDGDSSCLWVRSDDVTGGGETVALNTIENQKGHLGRVKGHRWTDSGKQHSHHGAN